MIRPAVFLTPAEFAILIGELYGSEGGQTYEPVYRELGWVEPLRIKIQEAIGRGERVVLCPDVIGGPPKTVYAAPDGRRRRRKRKVANLRKSS